MRDPVHPNWDQDETAIADRYDTQDPATVTAELETAAEAIAARFSGVTGAQWDRPGQRGDGAAFTVETFARYFIHDPVHHLYDVTGTRTPSGLRSVQYRRPQLGVDEGCKDAGGNGPGAGG